MWKCEIFLGIRGKIKLIAFFNKGFSFLVDFKIVLTRSLMVQINHWQHCDKTFALMFWLFQFFPKNLKFLQHNFKQIIRHLSYTIASISNLYWFSHQRLNLYPGKAEFSLPQTFHFTSKACEKVFPRFLPNFRQTQENELLLKMYIKNSCMPEEKGSKCCRQCILSCFSFRERKIFLCRFCSAKEKSWKHIFLVKTRWSFKNAKKERNSWSKTLCWRCVLFINLPGTSQEKF